jgi:hypothetical protein
MSTKEVVLTFDDGWRNLWTVVYPLLKKYGQVAVSFIVPSWINNSIYYSPNYMGHWNEKDNLNVIFAQKFGLNSCVNWREIKRMHESGVIDFQSHSLTHGTVFTSDRIVDFLNPQSIHFSYKIPFSEQEEQGPHIKSNKLGAPLYTMAPRLTGAKRYIDEDGLRDECVAFVKNNGGKDFFRKREWRKQLSKYADSYRTKNPNKPLFESDCEREQAIVLEFMKSKLIIEKKLNKTVKHFCYPFFSGSRLSIEISKRCGYVTNFWGWQTVSNKLNKQYGRDHKYQLADPTDLSTGDILKGRRTNRHGDNPFTIVRVPGDYIYRLPGDGRLSIRQILIKKFIKNLKNY